MGFNSGFKGLNCKQISKTAYEGKGKVHPCTGTEALYSMYGPQGE